MTRVAFFFILTKYILLQDQHHWHCEHDSFSYISAKMVNHSCVFGGRSNPTLNKTFYTFLASQIKKSIFIFFRKSGKLINVPLFVTMLRAYLDTVKCLLQSVNLKINLRSKKYTCEAFPHKKFLKDYCNMNYF